MGAGKEVEKEKKPPRNSIKRLNTGTATGNQGKIVDSATSEVGGGTTQTTTTTTTEVTTITTERTTKAIVSHKSGSVEESPESLGPRNSFSVKTHVSSSQIAADEQALNSDEIAMLKQARPRPYGAEQ